MYNVYVADNLFSSPRYEDLAIINPVITLEANKAGTFKFTIPPVHPMYDDIHIRNEIITVYLDEETEPLFEGQCTNISDDFYKQRTITCEGALSFLNDSTQRPYHFSGVTPYQLLNYYLRNHNNSVGDVKKQFTIGQVTVTDPNNSISCYTNYNSTMKEIKEDLVDDLGGYLRIRHERGVRYLDYLKDSPRINTQTIKIGMNLLSLTKSIQSDSIATMIIPLGTRLEESSIQGLEERLTIKTAPEDSQHPSGTDYVYSASAISNFGVIEKVVTFDDVTTVSALLSKGKKYLSDYQFENMVLEVKAIDLGITDAEFQKFRLLDTVRVVSTPHGLDREFLLTKMTYNLNKPENDSITLGKNEKTTMSAKSNQISNSIKSVSDSVITRSVMDGSIESAVDNATALITGAEGGYVVIEQNQDGQPIEIKIQNSLTNPTKMWRWNQNGFGYSNDGGQTYGLAMTMDGAIVADFITAGTMTGITINGVNINGTNINGSVITSSGSVKRYASDYTQADTDRLYAILNGQVTPTDADYEKLDLNADGVFSSQDIVICNKLVTGQITEREYDTSISISGAGNKEIIKANNMAIGAGYVRTQNGTFSRNLAIGDYENRGNVLVYEGTTQRSGYTGTLGGIKFINGIAVGTS